MSGVADARQSVDFRHERDGSYVRYRSIISRAILKRPFCRTDAAQLPAVAAPPPGTSLRRGPVFATAGRPWMQNSQPAARTLEEPFFSSAKRNMHLDVQIIFYTFWCRIPPGR